MLLRNYLFFICFTTSFVGFAQTPIQSPEEVKVDQIAGKLLWLNQCKYMEGDTEREWLRTTGVGVFGITLAMDLKVVLEKLQLNEQTLRQKIANANEKISVQDKQLNEGLANDMKALMQEKIELQKTLFQRLKDLNKSQFKGIASFFGDGVSYEQQLASVKQLSEKVKNLQTTNENLRTLVQELIDGNPEFRQAGLRNIVYDLQNVTVQIDDAKQVILQLSDEIAQVEAKLTFVQNNPKSTLRFWLAADELAIMRRSIGYTLGTALIAASYYYEVTATHSEFGGRSIGEFELDKLTQNPEALTSFIRSMEPNSPHGLDGISKGLDDLISISDCPQQEAGKRTFKADDTQTKEIMYRKIPVVGQ